MARAAELPGAAVAVCLAPVHAGDDARAILTGRERLRCADPSSLRGPGDYWALSAPLAGAAEALHVRSASLWQRRETIWARYADGAVARTTLDGHGVTRQLRLGAMVDVALPARGVPVARLLWRIDGAANLRGVLNGPALATSEQSDRAELIMGALYAAFAGLCVALLIYNLALWATLRHRFQLAYCAMAAALLAYALSSSGLLAWWCPAIANNDRLRINYLTLGACGATALTFARLLFEREVFVGLLGHAATGVVIALLGGGALVALSPEAALWWSDRVAAWSFVGLLGIVPPLLWRAWRRRSAYLTAFVLAWGAPVLLAAARVAAGLHLIAWRMWIDNSTVVSMGLEAMFSSLVIAHRVRLLSRECEAAHAREAIAQALADTDPLTGLLNRRAFLREVIGRPGEQLLILADIDHFKAVNDALGHDGGDEVLRAVARALVRSVPCDSLVARIGGEEFAIVLDAACAPPMPAMLTRVRAEPMPLAHAVTMSLGSCAGPLAGEADWKRLYRRADGALFEAKAEGRDRACAATPLAMAA